MESEEIFKLSQDYFIDLDKWLHSRYCNDCGNENLSYSRSVANGEVWYCKPCKREILINHQPNEDNY